MSEDGEDAAAEEPAVAEDTDQEYDEYDGDEYDEYEEYEEE